MPFIRVCNISYMYSLIIDYCLDSYALRLKPCTWSPEESVVWLFVYIELDAVQCDERQASFVMFSPQLFASYFLHRVL